MEVIRQIREALAAAWRVESNLKGGQHLATPVIRDISKQYFSRVKQLDKQQIFDLGEVLLESRSGAERVIAFDWAFRCRKYYLEGDFETFERWLNKYVDSWGSCDNFCTHAFGSFICQYPAYIVRVKQWAESDNRWLRRAAAVIMIYSVRRKENVVDAFQIADLLLTDSDDMVQKGYGWMLKEISKRESMRVFNYVMAHKTVMPRTSLRYAIEKLEPNLRQQAMTR